LVGTSVSIFLPLTRSFIFLFIAVPFSTFVGANFWLDRKYALGLSI
jgi:hypothetical protein